MPINWYPGHMAAARREIRDAMPKVDLVIEVLDARIPFSSENPLVAELRGDKPCIQILNKSDLADPNATAAWLAVIGSEPRKLAMTHHHHQHHLLRTVMEMAGDLMPDRNPKLGPVRAMILGIPNVGKSTLINRLAGRAIAKTGNKPAVTQEQQRIEVKGELILLDTPGFLWPKLTPEVCGYRLAVTGAISDRVVDPEDLAAFTVNFLMNRYPEALRATYGLGDVPPDQVLEGIGRRRGFLGKGGVVDLHKAADRLILDLRAGTLGRISLETPADWHGGRGE